MTVLPSCKLGAIGFAHKHLIEAPAVIHIMQQLLAILRKLAEVLDGYLAHAHLAQLAQRPRSPAAQEQVDLVQRHRVSLCKLKKLEVQLLLLLLLLLGLRLRLRLWAPGHRGFGGEAAAADSAPLLPSALLATSSK